MAAQSQSQHLLNPADIEDDGLRNVLNKSVAAWVHALTFSHLWSMVYFTWKLLLSIMFVVAIDHGNYVCHLIGVLLSTAGVWIYFAISFYLFHFIYLRHNGKQPYLFQHPIDQSSVFNPVIGLNLSQSETKYFCVQLLLFLLGCTMLFISFILEAVHVPMNDFVSIWYTLCSIPIFISMIMFNIWLYLRKNRCLFSIQCVFAAIISFAFLWILVCIVLRHDFGVDIHSLLITIPSILLFICVEAMWNAMLLANAQMVAFAAIICICCPLCLTTCSWITFIVLWIIYFSNDDAFTMSMVFIPVWFIWFLQTCHLLMGVVSTNSNDFVLTSAYGKWLMISSLDENTLTQLNAALQHKRDLEKKMVYIDQYSGMEAFMNNVLYRVRSRNIVADIISPNHVALNKDAYRAYIDKDIDDNVLGPFLSNNQNREQMCHQDAFFQWVPTEFKVQFKDGVTCSDWQRFQTKYMDIQLNSWYIADINQFKNKHLNQIILNILRRTIIPLFVCSIIGSSDQTSEEYKQLLFEWCSTQKILKIIVKSQQYEVNDNTHWDTDISRDYHVDGTLHEQVSHIAIIYTRIDDSIRGGNLHLPFDSELRNTWIFKPKQSSVIVFPNMHHKIDKISVWNSKEESCKRRILTFFLCSPQYFRTTGAYDALTLSDEISLTRTANPQVDTLMNLPLLTTNDLLPLDKQHCDDLLTQILQALCKNIPKSIIVIITEYIIDDTLLRTEAEMEVNARSLRKYRRDVVRCQRPRRPMVCD
eukprot:42395_1